VKEEEIDFEEPFDEGWWKHMEECQREWEEFYAAYEKEFKFANPLMNRKKL